MASPNFNVTRGPSKFDLMVSLFDGNRDVPRTVEFQLEDTCVPAMISITMIKQEDGSGESWVFEGWNAGKTRTFYVEGYYSSKNRTGYLTFVIPSYTVENDGHPVKMVSTKDQLDLSEHLGHLRSNR